MYVVCVYEIDNGQSAARVGEEGTYLSMVRSEGSTEGEGQFGEAVKRKE